MVGAPLISPPSSNFKGGQAFETHTGVFKVPHFSLKSDIYGSLECSSLCPEIDSLRGSTNYGNNWLFESMVSSKWPREWRAKTTKRQERRSRRCQRIYLSVS